MTKQQEKEIKRQTEHMVLFLSSTLIAFENDFLQRSYNWKVKEVNDMIEMYRNCIENTKNAEVKKHGWEVTITNFEYRIECLMKKINLPAIHMLDVFSAKKIEYDKKIKKVADLLVSEGFKNYDMRIENFDHSGGNMEFLISNDEKEVHARLIFAHGEVNAPHFRFITTVRKK